MMELYTSFRRWVTDLTSSWPSQPSLQLMGLGDTHPYNATMIQFFTWDSHHDDKTWWQHFHDEIPRLAELGITQVWLPPPNKAMSKTGRGYDAYDLWDLGEFDQKGSVKTRWGTKEQLLRACKSAKSYGIGILIDAVLGHKLGGDRMESFSAIPVQPENRLVRLGPPRELQGWTAYDFPGRGTQHSSMKWNYRHFTGIDWDNKTKTSAIYYIEGPGRKNWSKYVDNELGNYDYLLGCDIDHTQPDVKNDLLKWGKWILETTGAVGFRLDAIKHMDRRFLLQFLKHSRIETRQPQLFAVSEYWSSDVSLIERYIRFLDGETSFFDVPLHQRFHLASQDANYDLRTIFEKTLVQRRPYDAVTFVDNHDTQIGQSLESWVHSRFKIQAYALILLRGHGHPCVFYGDLYPNKECYDPEIASQLALLVKARKDYAYGSTTDYFKYRNLIGFVRSGDSQGRGCVVVLRTESNPGNTPKSGFGTELRMNVHRNLTGKAVYRDLLGHEKTVTVSADGWGVFPCQTGRASVWVLDQGSQEH